MRILKLIEKIIVNIFSAVAVVSLAVMIALGLTQIILRNCFDSGFIWADILIRALVLWVGFSGAVIATSKGRHIAIGALVKFLSPKAKGVAHVIVSIFTSAVSLFLTYASFNFVRLEQETGSPLFGAFPLWISELIIPITFATLTYQFIIQAFEAPREEEPSI